MVQDEMSNQGVPNLILLSLLSFKTIYKHNCALNWREVMLDSFHSQGHMLF